MDNIIGVWQTASDDIVSLELYGNVTLTFKRNGELTYQLKEGNKVQIIIMTYEIKGNELITNQLSDPREEITKFILDNDYLYLIYDNITSKYQRLRNES